MRFKTEGKFPIIHLRIGKISFGEKKLSENIKAMAKALPIEKVRKVILKSTMSPGIKINISNF
jgi:ribosomal protein L1